MRPLPHPFDPARAARTLAALAADGPHTASGRARRLRSHFRQQPVSWRASRHAKSRHSLSSWTSGRRPPLPRRDRHAGRRARKRRSSGHGHPAPRQAAGGPDRRAGGRRGLVGRRGRDAGAQPLRRRRRRRCTALSPEAGGRAVELPGRGSRASGGRDGPRRSRDGKIRRLRAQLFERRRSDRVLRHGALSVRQEGRRPRGGGRHRQRARQASRGDDGGRLCLPRRSEAQTRCGRHAGRDLDGGRGRLLREHGTELGTRRLHQGARLRRRSHRRRRFPESDRALHLAAQSRFRGDRGHPFDQAADPRTRQIRRYRRRRPQHQARPRRHSRDRILRADAAADPRRPQCGASRAGTLEALEALAARGLVASEVARRTFRSLSFSCVFSSIVCR